MGGDPDPAVTSPSENSVDDGSGRTPRFRTRSRRGLRSLAAGRRPRAGPAADARGRAGPPPRVRPASSPRTQLRGFYRDMVLVRRIDTEATALQRHGELGIWAQLLGQEAAQVGAGRALRPQDFVFPTYREHGVAWCRGLDPLKLLGLFRGVDHGDWDPEEYNFGLYTIVIGAQTLHATGYAMGMQRDGAVGTGDPDRDAAVIAHFGDGASSQGDVNEAFIFAASYNAPGRVLLPEQPVGDLRADRAADPDPALPARARLRLPRRPRRRQRRARDVRRHAGRAAAGPRRPGPDVRRGLHLPDGRAHHDRRPDPLPALRRRRALEAEGPDRPGRGLPQAQRPGRRRLLRRGRRRGRRARRPAARRRARRCPTRSRSTSSTTVYAEHDRRARASSATASRPTSSRSRGAHA